MSVKVIGVLFVLAVIFSGGKSQTTLGCSKLTALTGCFPDFQTYMDRGINITMVFKAFSGGAKNISILCGRFQNLTSCVDMRMRTCSSESDTSNPTVGYWNRAAEGIKYMCAEKKAEFLSNQGCLSKPAVANGENKCDTVDERGRKKRHSCADYTREIRCADDLITEHCGIEVARMVAKLPRLFLKNTPHTKDCTEPTFNPSTASSAPGSISTVSGLSFVVALLSAALL